MAKPKHPTLKSLRQGQTIYWVVDESLLKEEGTKHVVSYLLYSHKIDVPPPGRAVEKLPVHFVKNAISKHRIDMRNVFYSKKRAESAAKILK